MTQRLLVLIFVLTSVTGYAQEKWTLHMCVDYALKNNVSVKQSDVQARLTKLTALQSKVTLYPTLGGSLNSSYQHGLNENPTTGILQSASNVSGSLSVQSSYSLFTWNARKNTIAANNLLAKADEIGVDKAKNDITLSVANAFLQVMLRREQARISELQLNLSRSQLGNTRKLVNAGSQPELNAVQLEAQLAKDSSALLQSQALVEQALISLKSYLNVDFTIPFDIEAPAVENIKVENITDLQPAEVYRLAVNTQPLQLMYKVRIEASQKEVKAARGYMYPSLGAFAGLNTRAINAKIPVYGSVTDQPTTSYVTISNNKYPVYSPSFGIVNSVGTPFFSQLNRTFGQDIGLGINFSIFNSFTARTQWEKAKVNVVQLQLQSEQEDLNLKTNIYNAYEDAYASLQKYQASQRTVEYSQKAYDISKKRYDIGLLGTIDYIITQNNLYLAQIDEVSNHYDFIFRMKVLEFYKGQGVKF